MEETISLQEIMEIIRKHFKLIIAITIGAAIIATAISYFILTPIYQSSTQFILNESQHDGNPQRSHIDSRTIRTNVELINTYNVIIQSDAILDVVIENLEPPKTTNTLQKNIDISSEQNTQVVTVTAKDPDQHVAPAIAN